MYARSTTVKAAAASSIDAGIAHIRDVTLPALLQVDGCIGMSMMVDRDSRECTVTSSWESRDALRASTKRIEPLRTRAVEILGGTPEFRVWEIALMHREHRSHGGAYVRAAWLQTATDNLDTLVSTFRMFALPQLEQLDGFCSASFMIDHETGAAVSSTCFEDRATLDASRDQVTRIRTKGTQEAKAKVGKVGEYELAIAHLRVPEMA